MDWTSQLNEYENQKMAFLKAHIQDSGAKYKKFVDSLREFYILALFLGEKKFQSPQFKESRIKQLYAKSALDAYSVYLCLMNGLNIQTASIIRSQFETFVAISTIFSGNVQFNTKLYDNYQYVEKWLDMRSKQKLVANNNLAQKEYAKYFSAESQKIISDQYSNYKEYYHPRKPYHWAWFIYKDELNGRNPNLRNMAEGCGLKDDYDRLYGLLSISVHSSPLLAKWMASDKGVTILPKFSELTKGYALLSLNYLIKTIKSFSEHWLDPGEYTSLQSFIDANHRRVVKDF